MRTQPEGLDERDLVASVAASWDLAVEGLEYMPEGQGSFHWRVVDAAGERHFVTVDDLDHKGWLGDRRETVFAGLRRAFDTAGALRAQGGLEFVVAPVLTVDAKTVARLGSRYSVAVFPFLDAQPFARGDSGHLHRFGRPRDPDERAALVRMLIDLHQATPVVRAIAPRHRIELSGRGDLTAAFQGLDTTWEGGPFSEPARAVLEAHAESVTGLLGAFDRLVAQVATRGGAPVITHGEPHTGNVMRVGDDLAFFDWDTVGLAPPERDLWMLATDTGDSWMRATDIGDELAVYADATGREIDRAAMTLYRIRWDLDDIAIFIRLLRSAHETTDDTELAWLRLTRYLDGIGRGDC